MHTWWVMVIVVCFDFVRADALCSTSGGVIPPGGNITIVAPAYLDQDTTYTYCIGGGNAVVLEMYFAWVDLYHEAEATVIADQVNIYVGFDSSERLLLDQAAIAKEIRRLHLIDTGFANLTMVVTLYKGQRSPGPWIILTAHDSGHKEVQLCANGSTTVISASRVTFAMWQDPQDDTYWTSLPCDMCGYKRVPNNWVCNFLVEPSYVRGRAAVSFHGSSLWSAYDTVTATDLSTGVVFTLSDPIQDFNTDTQQVYAVAQNGSLLVQVRIGDRPDRRNVYCGATFTMLEFDMGATTPCQPRYEGHVSATEGGVIGNIQEYGVAHLQPFVRYLPNAYCTFHLTIDPGLIFSLIAEVSLESNGDSVTVHEGADETGPVLAIFTGYSVAREYYVSATELFLVYRSNNDTFHDNFRFPYGVGSQPTDLFGWFVNYSAYQEPAATEASSIRDILPIAIPNAAERNDSTVYTIPDGCRGEPAILYAHDNYNMMYCNLPPGLQCVWIFHVPEGFGIALRGQIAGNVESQSVRTYYGSEAISTQLAYSQVLCRDPCEGAGSLDLTFSYSASTVRFELYTTSAPVRSMCVDLTYLHDAATSTGRHLPVCADMAPLPAVPLDRFFVYGSLGMVPPPNLNCTWIIESDVDVQFQLEGGSNTMAAGDEVRIYNGLSTLAPLIAVYAPGTDPSALPFLRVAAKGHILIQFITDPSPPISNKPGVILLYALLPPLQPCAPHTILPPGYSMKLAYPPVTYQSQSIYANDCFLAYWPLPPAGTCAWTITQPSEAPLVSMSMFLSLQPGADYISLYDGPNTTSPVLLRMTGSPNAVFRPLDMAWPTQNIITVELHMESADFRVLSAFNAPAAAVMSLEADYSSVPSDAELIVGETICSQQVQFDSVDDLAQIENCTILKAEWYITLTFAGTFIAPNLRLIDLHGCIYHEPNLGSLRVFPNLTLSLPALVESRGQIYLESVDLMGVDMPNAVSIALLTITRLGPPSAFNLTVPALRTIGSLRMDAMCPQNMSFPSLEFANRIDLYCEAKTLLLPALAYVEHLQLGGLDIMRSCVTELNFTQLQVVVGSIVICHCSRLSRITAPALTDVRSTFLLDTLPDLQQVLLPSLRTITNLHLFNLDGLTSLDVRNVLGSHATTGIKMSNTRVASLNLSQMLCGIVRLEGNSQLVEVSLDSMRAASSLVLLKNAALKRVTLPLLTHMIEYHVCGGNLALQSFTLPRALIASLVVDAGNNQLSSIGLPRVQYAQQLHINSLDMTQVDTPNVTLIKCVDFTSTRVKSINLSALNYITQYMTMSDNVILEELLVPNLISIGGWMVIDGSSARSLLFPALYSVGSSFSVDDGQVHGSSLSANEQLAAFYACGVKFFDFNITITDSPGLSCFETRKILGDLVSMDDETDCNNLLFGSYGCSANFTIVVDPSKCGFTVACIQDSIKLVIVPAGTYTQCIAPLSFLGRSMVVRGAGVGVTVIDCQGHGSAMIANQRESLKSIFMNMTMVNGAGPVDGNGGALAIVNSSPTFINVEFVNNTAYVDGGGVYISGDSSPSFYQCVFRGNAADNGGGVAIENGASPKFMNCTFLNNTAVEVGGGLAYLSAGDPVSFNGPALISGNTAARGGGIYTDTSAQFAGLAISNNRAWQFGGGIAAVADLLIDVVLTLNGVIITGNTAAQGGGLFSYSVGVKINGGTLANNNAGASGGGIHAACSVTYRKLRVLKGPCNTHINITGAMLRGNQATALKSTGGGVFAIDVIVNLHDAVVNANTAMNGGGVYVSTSNLAIANTSISNNNAGSTGGGVYCETRGACQVVQSTLSNNYAMCAGGGIFWCVAACPPASGLAAMPLDTTGTAYTLNFAIGYGADNATDPVSLSFASGPDPEVVSGFPFSSSTTHHTVFVAIRDRYGQNVTAGINVLQMTILDALSGDVSSTVTFNGPSAVLAQKGVAAFTNTGPAAKAPLAASLNQAYTLVISHTAFPNVALSANFQLLGCAPGQGFAEEQTVGKGYICQACAPGTFADDSTNFTCQACGAGSFAAVSEQSSCAQCPDDTFQPSAGAAVCLPCAHGAHSRAGATECIQDAAVGLNTGAVAGVVIGVLLVLIICLVIAAVFLYRFSRRRTMAKYYLDEDATVRRVAGESALAMAVRKFITASTTTRIGGGEFTDVYKGRHEGQWIALKVLKGEVVGHAIAQSEFRREVIALSVLSAIKHPAIIDLKFYLERSPVCIGLEFCPNGSLKRALALFTFTPKEKVRMAAEICSALVAFHNHNIAHMDIKTDNILLGPNNEIKMADLGICRLLGQKSRSASSKTAESVYSSVSNVKFIDPLATYGNDSGGASNGAGDTMIAMETMGTIDAFEGMDDGAFTPQYVDPHRLLHPDDNADDTLRRSDVFSFGMVMWAIYQQEEPFVGISPLDLIEQRTNDPHLRPPPITACHAGYQSVMHAAWSTDPLLRPTMAQCLDSLRTILRGDFNDDLPASYTNVGEPTPASASDTIPVAYAAMPANDNAAHGSTVSGRTSATPSSGPEAFNSLLATTAPRSSANVGAAFATTRGDAASSSGCSGGSIVAGPFANAAYDPNRLGSNPVFASADNNMSGPPIPSTGAPPPAAYNSTLATGYGASSVPGAPNPSMAPGGTAFLATHRGDSRPSAPPPDALNQTQR